MHPHGGPREGGSAPPADSAGAARGSEASGEKEGKEDEGPWLVLRQSLFSTLTSAAASGELAAALSDLSPLDAEAPRIDPVGPYALLAEAVESDDEAGVALAPSADRDEASAYAPVAQEAAREAPADGAVAKQEAGSADAPDALAEAAVERSSSSAARAEDDSARPGSSCAPAEVALPAPEAGRDELLDVAPPFQREAAAVGPPAEADVAVRAAGPNAPAEPARPAGQDEGLDGASGPPCEASSCGALAGGATQAQVAGLDVVTGAAPVHAEGPGAPADAAAPAQVVGLDDVGPDVLLAGAAGVAVAAAEDSAVAQAESPHAPAGGTPAREADLCEPADDSFVRAASFGAPAAVAAAEAPCVDAPVEAAREADLCEPADDFFVRAASFGALADVAAAEAPCVDAPVEVDPAKAVVTEAAAAAAAAQAPCELQRAAPEPRPAAPGPRAPPAATRLHVQLAAGPPAEYFAVTGSHEALGSWSPQGGVPLKCCEGRWAAERPVALTTGGHVEFKFVRLRPDGVEWEEVPNRVLEVPMGDADVDLKCRWNGDIAVRLVEPDKDSPAYAANEWRQRSEEVSRVLAAQRRSIEKRREEHRLAQERRAAMAAQLRAEIAEARREATEEAADGGATAASAVVAAPPMAEVLAQGAAVASTAPPPSYEGFRGGGSCASSSCGGARPAGGAVGEGQRRVDEQQVARPFDGALGQGFAATYQLSARAPLTRPAARGEVQETAPDHRTVPASSSSSRPAVPSIPWGGGLFQAPDPPPPTATTADRCAPQFEGAGGYARAEGATPAHFSPTFERKNDYLSSKKSSRFKRQGVQGGGYLQSPRPRYDRSYGGNGAGAPGQEMSGTTSVGSEASQEAYHASLNCVSPSGNPVVGGPLMASHEVVAAFRTARERYAELRSSTDAMAAERGVA